MYWLRFAGAGLLVVAACLSAWAQVPGPLITEPRESSYDYVEAFRPLRAGRHVNMYRSASGKPGPKYWQNQANYRIEAELDPSLRRIDATLTLEYTNHSPDVLDFLWFQLDQNLFTQESIGQAVLLPTRSRYGDAHSTFDGGYQLEEVRDAAGRPLEYAIYDTRMQVFLPDAVEAEGGQVRLSLSYSFVMPNLGADRMGVLEVEDGEIFAVAQWYPRVAVYDDLLGWNNHPYTGPGEFYLAYGDFELEITVPSGHIVMSGAELLNPEEVYTRAQLRRLEQAKSSDRTVMIRTQEDVRDRNMRPTGGDKLTWKFRLENARDIAWASSPAFIVDGARINLPEGRTALALSAYPKESVGGNGWERSTEYTKASIEHYAEKWMSYPYPVAVNVAANVGGMEYPALAFCSFKSKGSRLWGVTDHEFGHTWFPMIVGNNERLHAWMDEGLTMFINELSTEAFNQGEYHSPVGDANRLALLYHREGLEPVMTPPHHMKERNIGILVYYKPAFGFKLLRDQILGADRFDRALRTYVADWAYKHPTPDDFFRTMERVAGEDLSWFWRGWFKNNWKLDQSLRAISYIDQDPAKGVRIVVDNLEQLPMPLVMDVTTVSGEVHHVRLPVEIWERNESFTVDVPTDEEVVRVEIDPNRVFPDMDPENNLWTAQ